MKTTDGSVRRCLGLAGAAVALAGTLIVPAAASAARGQSGPTQVKQVRVYRVGSDVKVDVTVSHPDAKARKVARRARNTGRAAITLRAADGTTLATDAATASLPLQVPRARAVQQTYRFALAPGAATVVASAPSVRVETVAQTRLDADGPGGNPPVVDTDTDTSDVPVESLDADPVQWQYHDIVFTTGPFCSIDNDDCQNSYQRFHPGAAPFQSTGGRVTISPTSGQTVIHFSENVLDSWLEGKVSSLASNRFEITSGSVPAWGKGNVTSAPQGAGTPGLVGGPLALDVESATLGHQWHIWGYVTTSG